MSTWTDVDPHIAPELDRSALLVIDTQVDFLEGGASPIPGTAEVVPAITGLLRAFRSAQRPIFHVVRLYDGEDIDLSRRTLLAFGAEVVRPYSTGSQVVAELLPGGAPALDPKVLLRGEAQELADGEWAMWKPRWGAFHRTRLDEHLRQLDVTTVVLAGCNYPNCPRAAVYGASERDYRVLIAADAVSGVQPLHLNEAARMGVLSASAAEISAGLRDTTPTGG